MFSNTLHRTAFERLQIRCGPVKSELQKASLVFYFPSLVSGHISGADRQRYRQMGSVLATELEPSCRRAYQHERTTAEPCCQRHRNGFPATLTLRCSISPSSDLLQSVSESACGEYRVAGATRLGATQRRQFATRVNTPLFS